MKEQLENRFEENEEIVGTRKKVLPMYVDRTFIGIPHSVTAAYENKWAGNITAYPLDADPVVSDPVYRKLEGLKVDPLYWDERYNKYLSATRRNSGKVAWGLLETMKARKMNEQQYNHISKTPAWMLKLEFALANWFGKRFGRQDVEAEILGRHSNLAWLNAHRRHAIDGYLKHVEYSEPGFWDDCKE